jgi:hypothetical protein
VVDYLLLFIEAKWMKTIMMIKICSAVPSVAYPRETHQI